jgi:hypothetical protein
VGVEQVAEASAAMHELWDEGLVVDCLVKYTSVMPLLVYCKHSGNIHVSAYQSQAGTDFHEQLPSASTSRLCTASAWAPANQQPSSAWEGLNSGHWPTVAVPQHCSCLPCMQTLLVNHSPRYRMILYVHPTTNAIM